MQASIKGTYVNGDRGELREKRHQGIRAVHDNAEDAASLDLLQFFVSTFSDLF